MSTRLRLASIILTTLMLTASTLMLGGCRPGGGGGARQITLAVNSGVEGDALKQVARDYEALTGVRVSIAEFPYDNLFEKELIDLSAATGAYDLIMLNDPWFPRFATNQLLTDLSPLFQ